MLSQEEKDDNNVLIHFLRPLIIDLNINCASP